MNEYVKGIIINKINYNDRYSLLTIFTNQNKCILVKASGIERLKSKNRMTTQLGTIGDFELKVKNNNYTLINVYNAIQKEYNDFNQLWLYQKILKQFSLLKMSITSIDFLYFCRIIDYIEKDYLFAYALWMREILIQLGYQPHVKNCVECQNTKIHKVSIKKGGFVCRVCSDFEDITCTNKQLKIIYYFQQNPFYETVEIDSKICDIYRSFMLYYIPELANTESREKNYG